jgi:hypothetical protein
MCLSQIFVTAKNSKGKVAAKVGKLRGTGYKVLTSDGKAPSYHKGPAFKKGVWYKSDDCVIDENYTSGFHILVNEYDADRYHENAPIDTDRVLDVWLVEFDDVVAVGKDSNFYDDDGMCIVAKRMRLLEKVTENVNGY